MSEQSTKPADEWAIVELMGHIRIAGRISEEKRFGVEMGRIDIPNGEGYYTQFFSGSAVFRITYVGEAEARAVANRATDRPVSTWEMPKQLIAVDRSEPATVEVIIDEDDEPPHEGETDEF